MPECVMHLDTWGTWTREALGHVRHRMNRHDYAKHSDVRHRMNRHDYARLSDVWHWIDWHQYMMWLVIARGTWTCGIEWPALGYVTPNEYVRRLNVWCTWIREAFGDARHRMNKHDYVRQLDMWGTDRICTWICEALECVSTWTCDTK